MRKTPALSGGMITKMNPGNQETEEQSDAKALAAYHRSEGSKFHQNRDTKSRDNGHSQGHTLGRMR